MSISGVERIRDRRPFQCKPHLYYLGTAKLGTDYNSRRPTVGKLQAFVIDNQLNKADFTMLYARNLHYHSQCRNQETVEPVKNLMIGLFNMYYVMISQSAQI